VSQHNPNRLALVSDKVQLTAHCLCANKFAHLFLLPKVILITGKLYWSSL